MEASKQEKTDNELIAEFMGYVKKPDSYLWLMPPPKENYVKDSRDFAFNSSWDWLMPVVEKIESLQYKKYLYVINGYTFVINGRCAEVMDIERDTITKQQVGESKIKATYKAVVEFIRWHNSQKPLPL